MRFRPIFALASRVRENANRLILSELEKAGLPGIAPSHGDIFVELFRNDGCSMGELADHIRRTKSTVTTLVKKLEAQGYVTRIKRKDDARGTEVYLTSRGRELRPVLEAVSRRLQLQVERSLTEEEADQLEKLLQKMLENG